LRFQFIGIMVLWYNPERLNEVNYANVKKSKAKVKHFVNYFQKE